MNFRSRRGLIGYYNGCFDSVLSQSEQPGYVALSHTIEDSDDGLPCITKLTIDLPPGERADAVRDAEAAAVADVCARLIGAFEVSREDGSRSPLRPGDIALLAPTGADLWRYERALEAKRISVASQAGKTLMLRQETQDVLALLRALADPRDTLAFGALLRGPLVGLTDDELLQITAGLPEGSTFTIRTDPATVAHPLARIVLESFRNCGGARRSRRRCFSSARRSSSFMCGLCWRPAIATAARARLPTSMRSSRRRAPTMLLGCRPSFAICSTIGACRPGFPKGAAMRREDSVELVTMHSAKGLEWPVVIPINTATRFRRADEFVHRRSDDTLHWILGETAPPDLAVAREEENRSEARQRERLWYVACTRARDFLIVPCLPSADANSWCRIVDLGHDRLPELDLALVPKPKRIAAAEVVNAQTFELFATEAERVAAAAPPLAWRRPSDHDPDRALVADGDVDPANETGEVVIAAGAGRLRGILLHKLMEEFLTGELREDEREATERAGILLGQLARRAIE